VSLATMFDRATATSFKPPSLGEGVKKETVLLCLDDKKSFHDLSNDSLFTSPVIIKPEVHTHFLC